MIGEGPTGWSEDADLRAAGLVALLGTLATKGQPPDATVAREPRERVERELRASGSEGKDFRELAAAYVEKRGRDLLRKLIARTLHELYDLGAHGLAPDDVRRALSVLPVARGNDARECARAIAGLSRVAGRVVVGHLEGQVALVHKLASEEVLPSEVDEVMSRFAPRVFAVRLPSIVKRLLPEEPRLRLAVVLWGRFRGLVVPKQALLEVAAAIAPEKPAALVEGVAFRRDTGDERLLEDA